MIVIYYLGLSHAIFGSALLLTKRPRHISNVILAIWILLLGSVMIGSISAVPVISYFKPGLFPVFLCFGPFLFLYIKSITRENFRFSRKDILHFIPFALVVLHRSFSDPVNFGPGGGLDFRNETQVTNFIYYSLTTLSISIYSFVAIGMINKHKSNLNNIYSYQSSRYTLAWLRIVTIMFLIIFTFSFVAGYFHVIFQDYPLPVSFQTFGVVFFIIIAGFFGINQPLIFSEATKNIRDESSHVKDQKYSRSGLPSSQMDKIEKKIMKHLATNKPYLDSEYNINMLAMELNVPRHHITQVINSKSNKNFYTLINEFRVEEVINRINSGSYANYTLLAIAFDAGFNSKSAFNRIFKQITGQTPSGYKQFKD